MRIVALAFCFIGCTAAQAAIGDYSMDARSEVPSVEISSQRVKTVRVFRRIKPISKPRISAPVSLTRNIESAIGEGESLEWPLVNEYVRIEYPGQSRPLVRDYEGNFWTMPMKSLLALLAIVFAFAAVFLWILGNVQTRRSF